jgi:hypothetical protein
MPQTRSLVEIYSSAIDSFRLTKAPSTGFDYLDDDDDAGGRNLYKQLPRKAIFNRGPYEWCDGAKEMSFVIRLVYNSAISN